VADGRGGKALEVRWTEIGRAVDDISLALTGYRSLTVDVVGISIRPPTVAGGDFLLTVRGTDEAGGPVVAFHGSPDLGEAFRGLDNRLLNGSLRWRPDQFAGGR
jgi:hypothetical protein